MQSLYVRSKSAIAVACTHILWSSVRWQLNKVHYGADPNPTNNNGYTGLQFLLRRRNATFYVFNHTSISLSNTQKWSDIKSSSLHERPLHLSWELYVLHPWGTRRSHRPGFQYTYSRRLLMHVFHAHLLETLLRKITQRGSPKISDLQIYIKISLSYRSPSNIPSVTDLQQNLSELQIVVHILNDRWHLWDGYERM